MCSRNSTKLPGAGISTKDSGSSLPTATSAGCGSAAFLFGMPRVRFAGSWVLRSKSRAEKRKRSPNLLRILEAEALRKATLSLTQDLRMDFIMETLLRSLEELVPYTCARVLVPEAARICSPLEKGLLLNSRKSPVPALP